MPRRPEAGAGERGASHSPHPRWGVLYRVLGGFSLAFRSFLPLEGQPVRLPPPQPTPLRAPAAQATTHPIDPHSNCLDCHPHGAITGSPSTPQASQAQQALRPGQSESEAGSPKGPGNPKILTGGPRGGGFNCKVCHQGERSGNRNRATQFPPWTGVGSSHINGPYEERAQAYSRIVEKGPSRRIRMLATCNGCHDVHAKEDPQRIAQVTFDTHGQTTRQKRTTLAQMCFGCHAGPEAARLPRGDSDVGALFSNPKGSAHRPGATAINRQDLPSLRSGQFQGRLDCTSCHANPDPTGPRGPHFSPFAHLLKASYGGESDLSGAGQRSDELCYGCHDKYSIQGNQSFPLHAQHLRGFTGPSPTQKPGSEFALGVGLWAKKSGLAGTAGRTGIQGYGQPTPCATCHNPHGSPRNGALITFDKFVVSRSSVGSIDFQQTDLGHGNCTLRCHGYDHVQTRY